VLRRRNNGSFEENVKPAGKYSFQETCQGFGGVRTVRIVKPGATPRGMRGPWTD